MTTHGKSFFSETRTLRAHVAFSAPAASSSQRTRGSAASRWATALGVCLALLVGMDRVLAPCQAVELGDVNALFEGLKIELPKLEPEPVVETLPPAHVLEAVQRFEDEKAAAEAADAEWKKQAKETWNRLPKAEKEKLYKIAYKESRDRAASVKQRQQEALNAIDEAEAEDKRIEEAKKAAKAARSEYLSELYITNVRTKIEWENSRSWASSAFYTLMIVFMSFFFTRVVLKMAEPKKQKVA